MTSFAVLQKNALSFLEHWTKASIYNSSINGLFCGCLPSIKASQCYPAIKLLQKTAFCLDFYPNATEEKKRLVLVGIYLYVWSNYCATLQFFVNGPLVNVLKSHLNVKSQSDISDIMQLTSLVALEEFCEWVFQNQQFRELRNLYGMFPCDMQVTIHTLQQPRKNEKNLWQKGISSIAGYIGL